MRARTAALLAVAAIGLGACGDDEGDTAATTDEPAAAATTAAPSSSETVEAGGLQISTDTATKPEIPKPSGDPPEELVAEDVVKGTSGTAAKSGDMIVVNYVGVSHSDGEQFDASWDNGQPFNFTLGKGEVIPGWDEGIEGMKVGGRRILVIPPDKAYGAAGQGPIGPDETLVFVVDLLNVTSGGG